MLEFSRLDLASFMTLHKLEGLGQHLLFSFELKATQKWFDCWYKVRRRSRVHTMPVGFFQGINIEDTHSALCSYTLQSALLFFSFLHEGSKWKSTTSFKEDHVQMCPCLHKDKIHSAIQSERETSRWPTLVSSKVKRLCIVSHDTAHDRPFGQHTLVWKQQ